jgi:hypothetical protein
MRGLSGSYRAARVEQVPQCSLWAGIALNGSRWSALERRRVVRRLPAQQNCLNNVLLELRARLASPLVVPQRQVEATTCSRVMLASVGVPA